VALAMARSKRLAARMTLITVTKIPVPKTNTKMILCFLGSLIRHRVGIGRKIIAISVIILIGAVET
jgi:hypothetical protein